MIGQTVSHYSITRQLGAGGMGIVYEAVDVRHGGTVALKFLPPELSRDSHAKERFVEEARSAFALDHPNLCRVHELDETDDGQLFLAMTRYEGQTLKERLADGPLSFSDAEEITRQILRGLSAAHSKGIVHRDIKPANIFLTDDGELKILDFGLARILDRTRLTQTGSSMGTPGYMSPEQCLGQDADARSDLWSLGVVLYEMLSGRLPFIGDHPQAVIFAITNTDPEPITDLRSGIPDHLAGLTSGCLEKDPAKRPGSAAEILEILGESFGDNTRTLTLRLPASKRGRWTLGGAGLIATMVLLVLIFGLQKEQTAIASLAVLPLFDHSPETGQEFLADGLTDQLIANLGTIGILDRVISYSSVRGYRDNPQPLSVVARVLDVDGIIEGAITRIEDKIQITARLIDTRNEKQLWSQTFEHDYKDLLNLQNEVVRAIVEQISDTLTPEQIQKVGIRSDVDPEAYLIYLQGRDKFNQGYHTKEGILECIELFKHAIELDPDFAAAYAGLAESYNTMSCHGFGKPSDGYPKAREAVSRALALDNQCPEAHTALAHLLFENAWDFPAALREVDRAIELNPSFGFAHHLKAAGLLRCLGRHEEAVTVMRHAYVVDPLSANLSADLAMVLYCAGHFEEAMAQIKKTEAVFPDWDPFYDLVAYNLYKRDDAAALELLETKENDANPQTGYLARLAYFKGRAGKLDKARELLGAIEEAYNGGETSAYRPALAHLGLKNYDQAFHYLELAVEERFPGLTRLGISPMWDPVRDDPRFQEILRVVGLGAS